MRKSTYSSKKFLNIPKVHWIILLVVFVVSVLIGGSLLKNKNLLSSLQNVDKSHASTYPWQVSIPETFPQFFSSDPDFDIIMNDMFYRHYSATVGPSAISGAEQTIWREWNALTTLWINTSENKVISTSNKGVDTYGYGWPIDDKHDYNYELKVALESTRVDSNGYVWMYGIKSPGWPFPTPDCKLQTQTDCYDTRHPITNTSYILAHQKYLVWTGDKTFLFDNISKIRSAMHFLQTDLKGDSLNLIQNTWKGHNGLTGAGNGLGSNYYDLLPFGWNDGYATNQYFAALNAMAEIEQAIQDNPTWNIPANVYGDNASTFKQKADRVKSIAGNYFWWDPDWTGPNPSTKNFNYGRFLGTVDQNGGTHDYGFTFSNLESIYYNFASDNQSRAIYKWLDGQVTIPGDTSTGADIYHWRFAPRATTKDNRNWYMWQWTDAGLFGDQVQNGGTSLYLSFFDILGRIKYLGSDNAYKRLSDIAVWYKEVQDSGGYRSYYNKNNRGNLQGCGTPGGLGLDCEFTESSLVPTTIIYGFLGIQPKVDSLIISPKLPSSLTTLGVQQLAYKGMKLKITANKNTTNSLTYINDNNFEIVVNDNSTYSIKDQDFVDLKQSKNIGINGTCSLLSFAGATANSLYYIDLTKNGALYPMLNHEVRTSSNGSYLYPWSVLLGKNLENEPGDYQMFLKQNNTDSVQQAVAKGAFSCISSNPVPPSSILTVYAYSSYTSTTLAKTQQAILSHPLPTTALARMRVSVNDVVIPNGEISVKKTEDAYSFYYPNVNNLNASKVKVAFINDTNSGGYDLNLVVSRIVVNGTTYNSNSPRTYVSDGACGEGFLQTTTLACNGYFQYDQNPPTESQGTFGSQTAQLTATQATFNFYYSGRSPSYQVDLSTTPDMSRDTYLTFAANNTAPVTLVNPQQKWDKYQCQNTLYWRVYNSDKTIASPIQSITVDCPNTTSNITVYANGSAYPNVYAKMQVLVDDIVIPNGEVMVNTSEQAYNFYYPDATNLTANRIKVAFINDTTGNGSDLNLSVSKIIVKGVTYNTNDARTYVSQGACGIGFLKTNVLGCNGYFYYDQNPAISTIISHVDAVCTAPGTVKVSWNTHTGATQYSIGIYEGTSRIYGYDRVDRDGNPNTETINSPAILAGHTYRADVYAQNSTGNLAPSVFSLPFTCSNTLPIGYLDNLTYGAYGWAADPDAKDKQVQLKITVDQGIQLATAVYAAETTVYRQDIVNAGYPGNHGYLWPIPDRFKDGKTHNVYVYAVDINTGETTLLTGAPQAFAIAGPSTPPANPTNTPTPTNNVQTSTIVVYAKSTYYPGQLATMQVKVDDTVIPNGQVNVTQTEKAYNFTYKAKDKVNANQIKIRFTNDAYNSKTKEDLNLIVSKIIVNSKTYMTNDSQTYVGYPSITDNSPCESGYQNDSNKRNTLSCNGYFNYDQNAKSGIEISTIAIADARVNAKTPNTILENASRTLFVGIDPEDGEDISYLKFAVDTIPSNKKVKDVWLHISSKDGSKQGLYLYRTTDNWSEDSVKWSNRPARMGTKILGAAPVESGTWKTIKLTNSITSNGTYSFGMYGNSADVATFNSHESGDTAPYLNIQLE